MSFDINYLEIRFDYGAWSVEICRRGGRGDSIHEWLIVALWRAWRRSLISPMKGER